MFPLSITYQILRQDNEPFQRYIYRNWFVAKQNPKTETELAEAIKWSLIDTSVLYDQCTFPDDMMDLLKRMRL
jgi:hypothetical protein